MAGVYVAYTKSNEDLAAATAETIIQVVAPAQQRLRVKSITLSFDSTTVTAEPVDVRVLRQTTAGTSSALTGVMINAGSETVQSSGLQDFTAEPTAGNTLFRCTVHPQGTVILPLPLDMPMEVPGGGRLGIEVTAAAIVNCTATVIIEE